jgi:hypothetical protein
VQLYLSYNDNNAPMDKRMTFDTYWQGGVSQRGLCIDSDTQISYLDSCIILMSVFMFTKVFRIIH